MGTELRFAFSSSEDCKNMFGEWVPACCCQRPSMCQTPISLEDGFKDTQSSDVPADKTFPQRSRCAAWTWRGKTCYLFSNALMLTSLEISCARDCKINNTCPLLGLILASLYSCHYLAHNHHHHHRHHDVPARDASAG